ncbi:TPA: transposase [Legionella pneumophila]|nr:transposase [Legionella pneumophila]
MIDNSSFYQSTKIKNLIGAEGVLVYLPPYSSDLNPREHYWHKTIIKEFMREPQLS